MFTHNAFKKFLKDVYRINQLKNTANRFFFQIAYLSSIKPKISDQSSIIVKLDLNQYSLYVRRNKFSVSSNFTSNRTLLRVFLGKTKTDGNLLSVFFLTEILCSSSRIFPKTRVERSINPQ